MSLAEPKYVAVVQSKGGAGKTTTTVNLAVAAAYDGYTPAIIDFDTNKHSLSWGGKRKTFNPDLPKINVVAIYEDQNHPKNLIEVCQQLTEAGHDLIIIDTPGFSGSQYIDALCIADIAVCPFKMADQDIGEAAKLNVAIRDTKTLRKNSGLKAFSFAIDCSTHANAKDWIDPTKYIEQNCDHINMLADCRVKHRDAFRDASYDGSGVVESKDKKARAEVKKLWGRLSNA